MSRISKEPRELGTIAFVGTPFLQTGIVSALTALGTLIGRDGAKLANMVFSNIPTQKCIEIAVASMATTTGAISLWLMFCFIMFGTNKPTARYNNATNNSIYIAGASTINSFLSPFLGAYLMYHMSLQDSAFVGTVSVLGTAPLITCFFMLFGLGKILEKHCGNDEIPAEKSKKNTQGTQTIPSTTEERTEQETVVIEIQRQESNDTGQVFDLVSNSRPHKICFIDRKHPQRGHCRNRSLGSTSSDVDLSPYPLTPLSRQ